MEEASAGPSGKDVKKKSMLDQVCEAIRVLGKPKKGASAVAIKKYILNACEESEHGRVNFQFKKALAKGEEAGLLVRPTSSKNSVGATGSFLLKDEKSKTVIAKPPKVEDDKNKNVKKKLFQEESKVVKKPNKPKATKAKNPKKKEESENKDDSDSSDRVTHSTPVKSDSSIEQKAAKPRALKKTAKAVTKDSSKTFVLKKHSSDSELSGAKQETVKRQISKEASKTTKNNKPGKSAVLKETEKASNLKNEEKKKPRRILKSHNSDSVLL